MGILLPEFNCCTVWCCYFPFIMNCVLANFRTQAAKSRSVCIQALAQSMFQLKLCLDATTPDVCYCSVIYICQLLYRTSLIHLEPRELQCLLHQWYLMYQLSSCLLVLSSLSSFSRQLILSSRAVLSAWALWLACRRASSIFRSYQRSICRVTASKKYCVTSSACMFSRSWAKEASVVRWSPKLVKVCAFCLAFALCWVRLLRFL